MSGLLPNQFVDLERFIEWALPTITQRNRKRLSSSMEEIQQFYDAMQPRIDSILAYLDDFALNELPTDARHLLHLALALAEVSDAVELFHEPGVTGGCDPTRFVIVDEPNP